MMRYNLPDETKVVGLYEETTIDDELGPGISHYRAAPIRTALAMERTLPTRGGGGGGRGASVPRYQNTTVALAFWVVDEDKILAECPRQRFQRQRQVHTLSISLAMLR